MLEPSVYRPGHMGSKGSKAVGGSQPVGSQAVGSQQGSQQGSMGDIRTALLAQVVRQLQHL